MVEPMARIVVTTAAAMLAAASQGLRLHHRQNRAYAGTGRVLTGRPSMKRRSSSRSSPAVAYRSAGSLARVVAMIAARSGWICRSIWRRGTGWSCSIWLSNWCGSAPVEDRPQSQELVQGRAQGVDVVATVGLALQPLRRHVAKRPREGLRGRLVFLLLELGQAKVGDPGVAQGVEQDVVRLDVAVDHLAFVGVIERIGDLGADAGNLTLVAQTTTCRSTTSRG